MLSALHRGFISLEARLIRAELKDHKAQKLAEGYEILACTAQTSHGGRVKARINIGNIAIIAA